MRRIEHPAVGNLIHRAVLGPLQRHAHANPHSACSFESCEFDGVSDKILSTLAIIANAEERYSHNKDLQ